MRSFRFIWIPMPWVCGHYKDLIVSAPEIDPRTERVKMPLGECLLFIEIPLSPVNMLNVGLALCQRRRRWTNVKPSLGKLLELLDMPCHGPETIISYSNKAALFKCVIYTPRMVPKSKSEEELMLFLINKNLMIGYTNCIIIVPRSSEKNIATPNWGKF